MKPILKNYRHTISLAAVCVLAFALVMLGAPISTSILIVGLWQLSQFALSKRCAACFETAFTPEQMREFERIMNRLRDKSKTWDDTATAVDQLERKLKDIQRMNLSRMGGKPRVRGQVSDEAAESLAAAVVLYAAKSGRLEALIPEQRLRDVLYTQARNFAGITRDMTTTEIPLPAQYGTEVIELIAEFGVVRNDMFNYPMSGGESKPPRVGTRPQFGSIAMNTIFSEKKPTIEFGSLISRKIGGHVIMPREIDEQSLIPMGRFLAQYGALEFARAEDTWGFLADGTATYEGVEGVSKVASDAGKKVILGAGKTKPTDAVLDNFRALRRKVSTAALAGGMYYLNQSWEGQLRNYNTVNEKVFDYRPDGTATLDGFAIRWTEVLQPASDTAAPDTTIAAFGKLKFWLFGTRGAPRIDTSDQVLFLYDQIATRFLEEIDFDYLSIEAMAVMKTAP